MKRFCLICPAVMFCAVQSGRDKVTRDVNKLPVLPVR